MRRSWVLTGLENAKKKNLSRIVFIVRTKNVFQSAFFPNMGSESGSLCSGCKEKQRLPLSSSTESLTPQWVEGQDETLVSICTCNWTQRISLSLERSLERVPVTPLYLSF